MSVEITRDAINRKARDLFNAEESMYSARDFEMLDDEGLAYYRARARNELVRRRVEG